jgi:hypothetical protein
MPTRVPLRSRRLAALLTCLALAAAGPAQPVRAQTLAEVTLVAAIATNLDSSVRLPSGSLRAVGPGVERLLASLPDGSAWTAPEAYVARGLAANLRDAYEHQVVTGFAAAGYFEVARATRPDPARGGTRTRVEFEGPDGRRTLLVLFDAPDEVVWLVARAR